eukprot:Awhi_evm3s10857
MLVLPVVVLDNFGMIMELVLICLFLLGDIISIVQCRFKFARTCEIANSAAVGSLPIDVSIMGGDNHSDGDNVIPRDVSAEDEIISQTWGSHMTFFTNSHVINVAQRDEMNNSVIGDNNNEIGFSNSDKNCDTVTAASSNSTSPPHVKTNNNNSNDRNNGNSNDKRDTKNNINSKSINNLSSIKNNNDNDKTNNNDVIKKSKSERFLLLKRNNRFFMKSPALEPNNENKTTALELGLNNTSSDRSVIPQQLEIKLAPGENLNI